jgi:hypothetical protein
MPDDSAAPLETETSPTGGVTTRSRGMPMALMTWALIALVLLLVVVLVAVKIASSGRHERVGAVPPTTPAPTSVLAALEEASSLSARVASEAGISSVHPPDLLGGAPPLVQHGRPLVFYAGAEFCPYCAAERWPLVVALERFGTFTKLSLTSSSPAEVFGDTPSVSFRGASYSSRYIAFEAVEEYANRPGTPDESGFARTATLSPLGKLLVRRYDAPPYVTPVEQGALPFVDIAGRAIVVGAAFSPGLLAGSSVRSVLAALHDPASPVFRAVIGAADLVTAVICEATGGRPDAVCSSPAIRSAVLALGS